MVTPFEGAKYFPSEGSQKAVLLLHAYTGSPMDVNMLGRLLNRQGYTVLAPLFEGHGQDNMFVFLQGRPHIWQSQTREWIQWLQQEGYEYISVFGLSMGGIFATWAMTQEAFQLTSGGVFNSPVVTPHPINIERPFMRYAQATYEKSGAKDFDAVYTAIVDGHRQQIAALEDFKTSLYDDLAKITQPFFIAQSLQDELVDEGDAKYLQQALIHSNVSYHEYPNCTHVITVNRHRQEFEADLVEFLNRTIP